MGRHHRDGSSISKALPLWAPPGFAQLCVSVSLLASGFVTIMNVKSHDHWRVLSDEKAHTLAPWGSSDVEVNPIYA